jgi:hypothetical protein
VRVLSCDSLKRVGQDRKEGAMPDLTTYTRRQPRLEQSSIRSNFQISGREIDNTKT